MYKICFYVPENAVEKVKNALFAVGAGKIGDYSCCAWQTLGEGQFMPLVGSNPSIGTQQHLTKVKEYKVELVCQDELIHDAIHALKTSHPYEEPGFQIFRVEEF